MSNGTNNTGIKPILFNTDMVRAILDGRKTVTRRVVKPQPVRIARKYVEHDGMFYPCYLTMPWDGRPLDDPVKPPYQSGDILYVRETWCEQPSDDHPFVYRASVQTPDAWRGSWYPSIHMPKEAARIFLRVKDVRVERLQSITAEQTIEEGVELKEFPVFKPTYISLAYTETILKPAFIEKFSELWDSTIKKADRAVYGWEVNPWVWVIEFERISREEARG